MIVITGAAGFIGSALIWALNRKEIYNILAVDTFEYPDSWKNLRGLKFNEAVYIDDFIEGFLTNNWPEIKTLVHLGACSSTTEKDLAYLLDNNYRLSVFLCKASLDKGVKFVTASSAATYGLGEKGFIDYDEELLLKLKPLNAYAYSKHLFDLWAYNNGILKDIVILKYFNVFGPNEYHKKNMRSMVLKAFEQIRETGRVRLFKSYKPEFKDGEQKRDFVYIKDAVEMTLYLMDNYRASGIYNVGSGIASSWIDLVSPIFESLDMDKNIEFIDMPEDIRGQYQYFTQAELSKLRTLGYDLDMYSLKNAVRDYVINYLVKERFLGDDLIDITH